MAYKENSSVLVNDNGEWTHSSFNTYTLTQTNIEATQTKITASDAASGDFFGNSVAVGHGRIVVSAYGNDDVPSNSGSAYIFDLNGNQLAKLTASDAAADDLFGSSVAVGNGRIVVGAQGGPDAAYVFDLAGNQLTKITASDADTGDAFGASVAVGSDRIVVGAPSSNDAGTLTGSAYIFDLDGTQLAKITASDAASFMSFGSRVVVGNGKIVVSASGDNSNTGAAYIYNLDGTFLTKITASDGASGDRFGGSVAVGSGRIVVGANNDDDDIAGDRSGSAYIFDLNGNQLTKITASDATGGDRFGISVAVGNGRIVVGAFHDSPNGTWSGSAYVFDLNGTQLAKITASDGAFDDEFGSSVVVGNGKIVVSAPQDDTDSGSAYIYDLPETTDIYWENIIENYKW